MHDRRVLELRNKRICRMCLRMDEPLLDIFNDNNNQCFPLVMQILSTISLEVLVDDKLPNTICVSCRNIIDFCYKYKQACRKSENELKQYIVTGIWPQPNIVAMLTDKWMTTSNLKRKRSGNLNSSSESLQTNDDSNGNSQDNININLNNEMAYNLSPQSIKKPTRILNSSNIQITNNNILLNNILKPSPSLKATTHNGLIELNLDDSTEFDFDASMTPSNTIIDIDNTLPNDVFPCDQCQRTYPLKQMLDIHLIKHDRERLFECANCPKRFFSKYDLAKHTIIHTGEKRFMCSVCPRGFSRSVLLQRHEQTHLDVVQYECAYCNKHFVRLENLKRHEAKHKVVRNFACQHCDKTFAFKQGLDRHELIHSNMQPHACSYCGLGFPTTAKLTRHLISHAGSRPFPCRICQKSFLLSHHLDRHMRTHLNQIVSTTNKSERSSSSKSLNIEQFDCFICNDIFSSYSCLMRHYEQHAHKSGFCPFCKIPLSDQDVINHINEHETEEQTFNSQMEENSTNNIMNLCDMRQPIYTKHNESSIAQIENRKMFSARDNEQLKDATKPANSLNIKILQNSHLKTNKKSDRINTSDNHKSLLNIANNAAQIKSTSLSAERKMSQKTINLKKKCMSKQIVPAKMETVRLTELQIGKIAREGKLQVKNGLVYLCEKPINF